MDKIGNGRTFVLEKRFTAVTKIELSLSFSRLSSFVFYSLSDFKDLFLGTSEFQICQ